MISGAGKLTSCQGGTAAVVEAGQETNSSSHMKREDGWISVQPSFSFVGVPFGELPEQEVSPQERIAFNLLEVRRLCQWNVTLRHGELPWVDQVLIPVNHLVAERPQYVLDVAVVNEENQLVAGWVVEASLDEQLVLWVGRFIFCGIGK